MTEKKSETTRSGTATEYRFPLANADEMSELNKRAFEFASRASHACFRCVADYNQELTGFVTSRLKKDAEAMRAAFRSKTGEEALEAQANFIGEMLKDYSEGATRMFALSADAWKEAFSPREKS